MLNILPRFTRAIAYAKACQSLGAGREEYNCVTPALQLGFCSG